MIHAPALFGRGVNRFAVKIPMNAKSQIFSSRFFYCSFSRKSFHDFIINYVLPRMHGVHNMYFSLEHFSLHWRCEPRQREVKIAALPFDKSIECVSICSINTLNGIYVVDELEMVSFTSNFVAQPQIV